MNDLDYESTLLDRVAKNKAINEQYDLLNNSYISYSGGEDSDVASELIDITFPGNKIPRLHINTGVEYRAITKHVREKAKNDSRFIIINSNVNIKKMLKSDGYPFKSKQHSHNYSIYDNNREEASRYFEMVEKDKSLLKNFDFIHDLPKGIKTNVKYVYGVRERERDVYEYQKLP